MEVLSPETFPNFSMGELNIIEFYSNNCDSCIVFEEQILDLLAEFENVTFGKINCDDFPEFSKELPFKMVPTQPTVVLFSGGKPLDGFIGYKPNAIVKEKLEAIQRQQELEAKMKSGEINFKEAYDFTLKRSNGEEFTLSKEEGLIILDFWATWCPPCKEEIPYLQEFYNEYKDRGLKIVGITSDPQKKVNEFKTAQQEKGIAMNYILLNDNTRKVSKQYGIRNIPSTFFISPQGKLIKKEVGFSPEVVDEFRKIIEENLPE